MPFDIFQLPGEINVIRDILRRSFTKYLLSYIICLILPTAVFTFVYKTIFLEAYSRQIITRTTESIENTFQSLDLRINNFDRISYQILSSKTFNDAFREGVPPILTYFSIKDILNDYIYTNESIFDIWCFDRQKRYFYSPKNMFTQSSFGIYGPGYPAAEFTDFLSSGKYQTWIQESPISIFGQDYSLVTYIGSYPYAEFDRNFDLIIQIKSSFFEQSFRSFIQYRQSSSEIIDTEGRLVYSLNPSMNQVVERIISAAKLPDNSGTLVKIGNKKYFVYTELSKTNGLKYLSVIPYDELIVEVNKFSLILLVIILCIMLCGSILIFFLVKYNYNPLKKLAGYARRYADSLKGQIVKMNEIDIIQSALESITGKNYSLLTRNKEYMRDHLLVQLVKGIPVSMAQLEEVNIDCRKINNQVVIFCFKGGAECPDYYLSFLKKALEESFPRNTIYLLEYLEPNSFIGIFCSAEEHPDFKRAIEAVCMNSEKQINSTMLGAIGNSYQHITDISQSYTQARALLRFQLSMAPSTNDGSGFAVKQENILKYIEAHYREKDFCVQTVADHFSLSFSNLSHQFKSNTGKNISSFISDLKLGYAKELLVTTNFSVSKIAVTLGYFQVSSFIRRFRQSVGMTPRMFRNRAS